MRVLVCFPAAAMVLLLTMGDAVAQGSQRLVFEEQRIEGKLRRPQMVLIRADQRPSFTPMVIQSLGHVGSITEFVDESVIEKSPHDGAFKFEGTKITNYVP